MRTTSWSANGFVFCEEKQTLNRGLPHTMQYRLILKALLFIRESVPVPYTVTGWYRYRDSLLFYRCKYWLRFTRLDSYQLIVPLRFFIPVSVPVLVQLMAGTCTWCMTVLKNDILNKIASWHIHQFTKNKKKKNDIPYLLISIQYRFCKVKHKYLQVIDAYITNI